MSNHRIFISYRRSTGGAMARMIRDRLKYDRHYETFLDVEDIYKDDFRDIVREAISKSDVFLLVLSKDVLDRCDNRDPEDNVRLEIEAALEMKKSIIFVSAEDFVWPEKMPVGLEKIRFFHAIPYVQEFGEAFFQKLYLAIEGEVEPPPRHRFPLGKLIIGIGCVAAVVALVLFITRTIPSVTPTPNPTVTPTPEPTQEPTQIPSPTLEPTNTPSEDAIAGTLFNDTPGNLSWKNDAESKELYAGLYAFGSTHKRSEIASITFLSSIPDKAEKPLNVSDDGSVKAWFEQNSGGLYDVTIAANGKIKAPKDCSYLFSGFSRVSAIKFNGCLDTSDTENMYRMFFNCALLTKIDLFCFNTAKVTDMRSMFAYCEKLKTLDLSGFDTAKVTDMRGMFAYCEKLETLDLSGFNTAKVTNMRAMFGNCEKLEALNLSGFHTENVTNMSNLFSNCYVLKTIFWNKEGFDTSNVTEMDYMFNECKGLETLDVSFFKTGSAVTMNSMFRFCESLTTLDLSNFDTSRVNNMNRMFSGCKNLEELIVKSFDTRHVTTMAWMFRSCEKLSTLNLENFDTSNVKYMGQMFEACTNLKEIKGIDSWDTSSLEEKQDMFKETKWASNPII